MEGGVRIDKNNSLLETRTPSEGLALEMWKTQEAGSQALDLPASREESPTTTTTAKRMRFLSSRAMQVVSAKWAVIQLDTVEEQEPRLNTETAPDL
jgi:hypothetical protein